MKTDAAFVKDIGAAAIENEKKRAEKEVKILKEELEKDHPSSTYIWDITLKVYRTLISKYPHIFISGYGYDNRVLQNIQELTKGFPLTAIDEENADWQEIPNGALVNMRKTNVVEKYRSNRLSSLFKEVYKDGHIEFHDNYRVTTENFITGAEYVFGLSNLIYDEMYPIKMPYNHKSEWGAKVYIHDFVSDPEDKESNFDTIAVLFAKEPGGKIVSINRYFRVPKDDEEPTYGNWVEIKFSEFADRVRRANSNLTIEDLDYSYLLDEKEDDQNDIN